MESGGLILLAWFALAFVPAGIAGSKGRNRVAWWALGVLVLPIALLAALLIEGPPVDPHLAAGRTTLCPHCREPVRPDASRCRWCQADIGDTAEDIASRT